MPDRDPRRPAESWRSGPGKLALALIFALALVVTACDEAGRGSRERSPNIVFLISDDQGYTDHGFMGSELVETPNLDRLAEQGLVFSHARSTASVCRPSLITLLTGLRPLQWEHGLVDAYVEGSIPEMWVLPEEVQTLPAMLRERGYASFQGGKFWEGSFEMGGFTDGMTDQPAENRFYSPGGKGLELGRVTMEPLLRFLEAHRSEPFFVWFAPEIPHVPHHGAPRRHLARYAGADLVPSARRYYAMCSWFDELVGELVAQLEALGLREDTLIVYLSDNGWDQRPDVPARHFPLGRIVGGPKGKLSMHELGFRTPILFNWPGRIEGGRRSTQLASTLDLVPTALDYAGLSAPASLGGESLRPWIDGAEHTLREHLIGSMSLLRRNAEQQAVAEREGRNPRTPMDERAYNLRTHEWSYIWYPARDVESLHRIEEDPREDRDLSSQQPVLVGELRALIEARRAKLAAPFTARARARVASRPRVAAAHLRCLEADLPPTPCLELLSASVRRRGGRAGGGG